MREHKAAEKARDTGKLEEHMETLHSKRKPTSDYRGVSWYKAHKKWRAHITHEGKPHHLGYFDDEDEAHQAYSRTPCVSIRLLRRRGTLENWKNTWKPCAANGNRHQTVAECPASKQARSGEHKSDMRARRTTWGTSTVRMKLTRPTLVHNA